VTTIDAIPRLVARAVIVASVALTVATAGAAETGDESERSFLWRATSGERSVVFLGSIHFMKEDAYPLSPAIEQAYEDADLLVFETDIDSLAGAAVGLMAAGSLDKGTGLEDVIPAELYDRLAGRFSELGMSIDGFTTMRPWMVALTLTSMELMRAGYLGSEGIDAHFNARAKSDGKGRRGLEHIDEQIALFAGLTDEEGVEFLRYTLDDLETMIPMVDELVAAWMRGDADRIEKLMVEGYDEFADLYDRFVIQRNHRWMTTIDELLDGPEDVLVIVGSLHLVGDEGLVELMRAKGFEIEQL
jgi:uncharacterized protein YbaP (TraB family)